MKPKTFPSSRLDSAVLILMAVLHTYILIRNKLCGVEKPNWFDCVAVSAVLIGIVFIFCRILSDWIDKLFKPNQIPPAPRHLPAGATGWQWDGSQWIPTARPRL